MAPSALTSLAGLISERLAQLESALKVSVSSSQAQPIESPSPGYFAYESPRALATLADCATALAWVQELQRQNDTVLFLQECATLFAASMSLGELTTQLIDALWQHNQFTFAVFVLGESELGPYYYQEMRGVSDARRYLKKQCPLPLWGELAHALVRRLDPEETDYLLISDIAVSGRPTLDEFPWMPRHGSLIILPLRKTSVAIGALILGRSEMDRLADFELCLKLVEFSAIAARVIIGAQIQEELHARVGQLVGLQLFSRSIAAPISFLGLLTNSIEGIIELMSAASVLITFNRLLIGPNLLNLLLESSSVRVYQNLIGIGVVATSDEPMTLFMKLYRLLMWTVDAGQPLFFEPSQPVDSPENLYYNETGCALMAPIAIGENAIGALYIEALPNAPGYDEADMVVLRTASNALAIALRQIG